MNRLQPILISKVLKDFRETNNEITIKQRNIFRKQTSEPQKALRLGICVTIGHKLIYFTFHKIK